MIPADIIPSPAGDITVQPINHASLVLGLGNTVIYLDPVGEGARYEGLPPPDLILLTHEHSDHFSPETIAALGGGKTPIIASKSAFDQLPQALAGTASVIAHGETKTIGDVTITALHAENTSPERLKFHPPGIGNGYVLRFGGKAIYVSGDTEETDDMRALEDIDIAFLPCDGHYTMDGKAAAAAARTFRPRLVYPFHYGQSEGNKALAQALADEPGIEVRLRNWYA